MLLRIACVRCRLGSLWTDEPHSFLATVCRDLRRCEATLLDEQFCGVTLDSTNQGRHTQGSSLRREGATEPCPSGNRPPALGRGGLNPRVWARMNPAAFEWLSEIFPRKQ